MLSLRNNCQTNSFKSLLVFQTTQLFALLKLLGNFHPSTPETTFSITSLIISHNLKTTTIRPVIFKLSGHYLSYTFVISSAPSRSIHTQ